MLSHSLLFSILRPHFFFSIHPTLHSRRRLISSSATPCSTPLLRATELPPLPPSLQALSLYIHRQTLQPPCRMSPLHAQTAHSLRRQRLTLPGRLHASNTSRTSFSPLYRARHLTIHHGLCCTHNYTIKG